MKATSGRRRSALLVIISVGGFFLTWDPCLSGPVTEENSVQAEDACDAEEPRRCIELGMRYLQKGKEWDPVRASSLFDRACRRNVPLGCYHLGAALALQHETTKAIPPFDAACSGGVMNACVLLGAIHADGLGGLAKDLTVATRYFKRACDGGVDAACQMMNAASQMMKDSAKAREAEDRELQDKNCLAGQVEVCAEIEQAARKEGDLL